MIFIHLMLITKYGLRLVFLLILRVNDMTLVFLTSIISYIYLEEVMILLHLTIVTIIVQRKKVGIKQSFKMDKLNKRENVMQLQLLGKILIIQKYLLLEDIMMKKAS